MAEINDNLSAEEIEFVEGILSPLSKNPLNSEELNPMAKIFRQKMGYSEPVEFQSETDDSSPFSDDMEDDIGNVFSDESMDSEFSDSEPAPPDFKNFDDDDEINLDELLAEDSPIESKSEPSNFDMELNGSGFDDSSPGEDDLDFGSTKDDDDNFDFGDSDSESGNSDFEDTELGGDDLDFGEVKADDNDFGLGDSTPVDEDFDFGEVKAEEDDLGFGDSTPDGSDFDFGDVKAVEDDLGFGDSTSSGDDFDFSAGTETSDDFGFGDIKSEGVDFDFGSPSSEGDIFGSSALDANDGGIENEDPFGDLGVDLASSPMDSDLGDFDDPTSDIEPPDLDEIGGGDLDPPDLDEIGGDYSDSGDGLIEDELSSLMEEEGSLDEGLTDEDLAIIQRELVKYPPRLRRQVVDSIVNNRISLKNQKELIEIIKHKQPPEEVAEYLSGALGEKVVLQDTSGSYADDGVPIISTNPIYTREGALRRRKLIKNTVFASAALLFLVSGIISLYKYIIVPGRAASYYEEGLQSIRQFAIEKDEAEKKKLLRNAKEFFVKGEEIDPHSLKYLNLYGIEYMKAGRYDDSFEMLFGKVDPPFQEWSKRTDVPYISIHPDSRWNEGAIEVAGVVTDKSQSVYLTSQDRVKRKILKPGAYIVARVKNDEHHIPTYINLGRFHSYHARDFVEDPKNKVYKNDNLAIEYYKRVFTDANEPQNIEARSGIAKIFYNRGEYPRAASEYNKILEIYPKSSIGHGGILSSYIEIWKRDGNPQFVLNHHRNLKNKLGIEKELSLFILSKLASFYIDLDPEETRIRYNVTPEDQVTGMDIDDNAAFLLNILFSKTEKIDGYEVDGSRYSEGYYQRGRLFLKQNEALRAMKQFELAASYDTRHYPAVLRMGEYYLHTSDYPEAENLFKNAERRYKDFRGEYGRRDEDETLMSGDPGRIYFNRGKILYLQSSGILSMDQIKEFPGRKIYPERAWSRIPDSEWDRRKRGLYLASEFFKLAETQPHVLQDSKKSREMIYYSGWIEYMLSNYQDAMNRWNDLDEEDLYHNTTLLMGMGNASFYTKQYNSALGYYKKIMDDYESKEAMIKRVVFEDQDHQEIYQILVAVYNNIGAVLESQGNNQESLMYYWKAIEAARKIELVSEIANSNKDLFMKKQRLGNPPLLEDWLSPTLDTLKDMVKM